jgi:hypothetical protein
MIKLNIKTKNDNLVLCFCYHNVNWSCLMLLDSMFRLVGGEWCWVGGGREGNCKNTMPA